MKVFAFAAECCLRYNQDNMMGALAREHSCCAYTISSWRRQSVDRVKATTACVLYGGRRGLRESARVMGARTCVMRARREGDVQHVGGLLFDLVDAGVRDVQYPPRICLHTAMTVAFELTSVHECEK